MRKILLILLLITLSCEKDEVINNEECLKNKQEITNYYVRQIYFLELEKLDGNKKEIDKKIKQLEKQRDKQINELEC